MTPTKQRVLLLGATGATGGSILNGLLEHKEYFDVEALVRPSSAAKPAVNGLVERGVQIRVGDTNGPVEDLVGLLTGVDVLISAIDPGSLLAQIQLATAAKEAGVKRFVPCAFTTVTPPGGVMRLRDSKEQVYQHIRKLFLPYTIIDVGYWYQISFPTLPSGRVDYAALVNPSVEIHANGNKPTMITDTEPFRFRLWGCFVRKRDLRTRRIALHIGICGRDSGRPRCTRKRRLRLAISTRESCIQISSQRRSKNFCVNCWTGRWPAHMRID